MKEEWVEREGRERGKRGKDININQDCISPTCIFVMFNGMKEREWKEEGEKEVEMKTVREGGREKWREWGKEGENVGCIIIRVI